MTETDNIAFRPLQPQLFERLRRVFRNVVVANPGEPMIWQRVATMVRRPDDAERSLIVQHGGEYYRVCCPYCNDARYRLWINHCYGQQLDGRPVTWLLCCYNEGCLENQPERRKEMADRIIGLQNRNNRGPVFSPPSVVNAVTGLPRLVDVPGEIVGISRLPLDHPAVRYLALDRGYDVEELDRLYQVGFCFASAEYPVLTGRIYMPVMFRGQLMGWQGRMIENKIQAGWGVGTGGGAKYYNLPGMPKSQMLYNYDRAVHCPFVVVNEGITDVWSLGDPAVALFGHSVSYMQRTMLLRDWQGKPIIFPVESNAWDKMAEPIATLRQHTHSPIVAFRLPPDKDPGDFSKEANWRMIYAEARAQGVELPTMSI